MIIKTYAIKNCSYLPLPVCELFYDIWQDGAQCRFETDHVALGCSSMLGPLLEWNFNVKV